MRMLPHRLRRGRCTSVYFISGLEVQRMRGSYRGRMKSNRGPAPIACARAPPPIPSPFWQGDACVAPCMFDLIVCARSTVAPKVCDDRPVAWVAGRRSLRAWTPVQMGGSTTPPASTRLGPCAVSGAS